MNNLNNGDMPASPLTHDGVLLAHDEFGDDLCVGLTKREAFAMAAMQGYLSSNEDPNSFEDLARFSVLAADALLKELSNVQT